MSYFASAYEWAVGLIKYLISNWVLALGILAVALIAATIAESIIVGGTVFVLLGWLCWWVTTLDESNPEDSNLQ